MIHRLIEVPDGAGDRIFLHYIDTWCMFNNPIPALLGISLNTSAEIEERPLCLSPLQLTSGRYEKHGGHYSFP